MMTQGQRGGGRNPDRDAMLSIGALSRATGVAVETLRTWERRYGFPVPERKPSGHRVYPTSSVPRLRRIAEALALGHRAGDVVPASEAQLGTLLGVLGVAKAAAPASRQPLDPEALLDLVARFDGDELTHALHAEWERLGPMPFLEQRAAPLIQAVGDAWESGRLEVRHEHFLSERVGDLLRAYRLPLDERARGPLVVLATLPGESHGLGLQMAALVAALEGCRVCYVGTEMPIEQLASLASDLAAPAIALSVSIATRGVRTAALLAELRRRVPTAIRMVAGGDGAPRTVAGVDVVHSLPEFAAWARTLVAAG